MILAINDTDPFIKDACFLMKTLYPDEKAKKFSPICLDDPRERNNKLPSRLSLVGHSNNLRFEEHSPKQLVSQIMSVLKKAAKTYPNIKHSIKDIDLVTCGVGHINPKTGQSYAIQFANLLAIELAKEGFDPIQVKAFTNLYGDAQQNQVEELSLELDLKKKEVLVNFKWVNRLD